VGWVGESAEDTYGSNARRNFAEALDSLREGRLRLALERLRYAERSASVVDERDWRLHIFECASAALALGQADPGTCGLTYRRSSHRRFNREAIELSVVSQGTDIAGLPILRETSTLVAPNVPDGFPYWCWKSFLDHAGRRFAYGTDLGHTSYILADMASQGHRKAFLKAARSKAGTWVLDLEGIRTPGDAAARIAGALGTGAFNFDGGMVVQEFRPFTHEHRFFVVGGRVVASTASDRDLCILDARESRIVDDRVALLARPASGHGYYDRGVTSHVTDPRLVAGMGRIARRVAREIWREQGIGDFTLDVGLAGGEIMPIEVNELERSGRYGVPWGKVARAFSRRIARFAAQEEARLDGAVRAAMTRTEDVFHHPVMEGIDPMAVISHVARRKDDVSGVDWDGTGRCLNDAMLTFSGRLNPAPLPGVPVVQDYVRTLERRMHDDLSEQVRRGTTPWDARYLANDGDHGEDPFSFLDDPWGDPTSPESQASDPAMCDTLGGQEKPKDQKGPKSVDWHSPRRKRSEHGGVVASAALRPAVLPSRKLAARAMRSLPARAPVSIDWDDEGIQDELTRAWSRPISLPMTAFALNGLIAFEWLPDGNGRAHPAEDVVMDAHRRGLGLAELAASACRAAEASLSVAEGLPWETRRLLGLRDDRMAELRRSVTSMGEEASRHGIDLSRHDDWLTALCLEARCGTVGSLHCRPDFIAGLAASVRDGQTLIHVAAASVLLWTAHDLRTWDRVLDHHGPMRR